jgi:WD40 repeat protein
MQRMHIFSCLQLLLLSVAWGQEPQAPGKDKYGDPLPPGAVARFGTVRFRAAGNGGFLPDGKTVVSASPWGHSVRVWDAITGKVLRELDTKPLSIRSSEVSPDGRFFAASGFLPFKDAEAIQGAVAIWDIASGKMVRQWPRTDRETDHCSLAFSPKGDFLFSLGTTGLLRIEEVATGLELLNHQFPRDNGGDIAVSTDGSMVAVSTGANTQKLFIWKWQGAEGPREIKVPGRVGRSMRYSPDDKVLAECADLAQEIRIWDTATGRLLRTLQPPGSEPHWHEAVVFTRDGKTLIAASHSNTSGAIHFWDVASWTHQRQIEGRPSRLAISPDSRLLTGGGRVWDVATGKEYSANDEAHRSSVDRIAVAAKVIASSNYSEGVRVWDIGGKHLLNIAHNGHGIGGIALSPDGKRLATASFENSVCLWDVPSGKRIYKLPGHGKVGFFPVVGFASDGTHFTSWGPDLFLRKWNTANGKAVLEHAIRPHGVKIDDEDAGPAKHGMMFLHFERPTFSANGKWFVLGAGNELHLFDVASGKEMTPVPNEGSHVIDVAISGDNKYLVASAWGKSVETKLPDGRTRYSSEKNHPICVWELATGKLKRRHNLPEGGAGPVAISPDSTLFAAAANEPERRIRIWDFVADKEIGNIAEFPGTVRSLAFTSDGERLVTGMEDGTILVWDWRRTKQ